ncbi:condensation domain-containing protein, partial [Streptomyces sp. NPDC050704]|uniref:condensation domain-containing protein n=1 Tax=Streptomyces sp. NPDC050704 TaxID=3157219 RepID=UPI00341F5645
GLEFLGRIDDQVKIRGFRIELGEIETALAAHPQVRDAVVLVREDTPGDKRLVAYLVPAGEQPPALGELRGHLAAQLPEYMVPSAFVALDALPLTTNGKLDKRALPAPGQDTALTGDQTYVAPRTVAEQRIADAVADVLGLDRVGVEDSFFDLGGDSIRALSLVGALREAGFDLAVRDVLENLTVAALAELATGRPAPATGVSSVEPFALLSDADRERLPGGLADAYPLSQAQLGMVVEMQRGDGRNTYHNVFSMRIRDEVAFDADALRRAVAEIVARHEVLRTSVDLSTYSVPMQLVHATAEIPFATRDLGGLDRDGINRAVREFTARERADVFDLDRAPLMRIAAHVEEAGAWWLAITECHVVMEGWSTFTLVMEVIDAYRQIRDTGAAEPYEAPAVRYADFVAAELDSLASAADRAYWRDVVTEYPRLALPQAWADAPGSERRQSRSQVSFGDLEQGLRGLAADARASLKSVLHAAHLKVMSQLTPDERFFTGLVCNARPEARGADRVYGMHLNTLPFAHDRSAATWRELTEQVFAREAELWSHRAFPMPEIQRELGDGRRLIDVPFSYQDFHQVDEKLIDTQATVGEGALEFGLRVSVLSGHINLSANNLVLGQAALDRLASIYRAVLEAMAHDPKGDARLAFLPAGERERQLTEWNDTTYGAETATVLGRFEEQAARTPGAVAVRHEGGTLSYGEL